MNINDLSKNIYVINLKERTDRKLHIENQLNKIDCKNYKLFEGVDGNSLTNPTKLKNGMFGLVKTYLNIHEEWSKKDAENILLIEDDCLFLDDFNKKLEEYINNVPSDWDIEEFILKSDETAGIQLGRTTIEGWMCGKPSWIYKVDSNGFILSKEKFEPPLDIEKYHTLNVAKQIKEEYIKNL
jgi:hypothetical protein